jgi:nucleotide-binding universal stress UspA family protein
MKSLHSETHISIKNILFLTDFSPVAENAGSCAFGLARRYGAKVFAVHARPIQVFGLAPPETWPVLQEALEEQAREQAQQLDRVFSGVEHDAFIEEGNVWDVVSHLVEEKGIDLIVMGTHGRRGVDKVLLGSVAEDILRRVPCPVLTVSPNVRCSSGRTIGTKNVLFCTSFSAKSEVAAAYAVSLAEQNRAHLDMLHVIARPKAGEFVEGEDLMSVCARRIRSLIPPDADLWSEPRAIVEQGDPAERILAVAKQRGADVIVMGAKSAEGDLGAAIHLPGTTVHEVICQAECPVLTVRG